MILLKLANVLLGQDAHRQFFCHSRFVTYYFLKLQLVHRSTFVVCNLLIAMAWQGGDDSSSMHSFDEVAYLKFEGEDEYTCEDDSRTLTAWLDELAGRLCPLWWIYKWHRDESIW